jgi:hypothetical protein
LAQTLPVGELAELSLHRVKGDEKQDGGKQS